MRWWFFSIFFFVLVMAIISIILCIECNKKVKKKNNCYNMQHLLHVVGDYIIRVSHSELALHCTSDDYFDSRRTQ